SECRLAMSTTGANTWSRRAESAVMAGDSWGSEVRLDMAWGSHPGCRMRHGMDDLTVVVLAAGEGKRMRSRQPKVLHELCGRPLIAYPLRTARALADRIVLVVGPNADEVVTLAGSDVRAVVQRERLGSGHAVLQAKPECG